MPAPTTAGLVLGIETATATGGVALVSAAGDLLGELTLRSRESHAERILPALEHLLLTLGARADEIAAVAVSSGPGSFTGLRAGVATAKGLSFSLGVPLYGVSTLEALAANVPSGEGRVCAVLNARRGEVFHALFRSGPSGPSRLSADRLSSLRDFAASLPPGCVLVGELPDAFPRARSRRAGLRHALPHLNHPRAAAVAARGLKALRASRRTELASLLPRYLRPPDAVPARTGPGIACADEQLRSGPHRIR